MAVHVSGLFTKGCRLGVVGLHCLTLTFPTTRKTAEVTPISGQRAWVCTGVAVKFFDSKENRFFFFGVSK